jgi:DNA-binding response OmpR family regulator
MSSQRILVVDDEPTVREVVAQYLKRDSYEVRELDNGADVARAITEFEPDLIVLDVMLPGLNGLDVLRQVGPNRVLGLELGADDYVTKPFSPRELVARVRTVLRRIQPAPDGPTRLEFDGLSIDLRARELTVNDALVTLTAKEFDLLVHMAMSPRVVFSRGDLLRDVWDSSAEYQDPATVTVHVRRLRQKIEHDPDAPKWITTVWGVGYRFEP